MNWTQKVERAQSLKGELYSVLDSFFKEKPYKLGAKRDPNTKRPVYYLVDVKVVPEEIALISGDIIQNLRSALDHLAYSMYLKDTGSKSVGRHIYFPIDKNIENYEKNKHKKTKGIKKEGLELFDSVKPYYEGNKIIWALHELNNIDKHRLLFTVGSAYNSVDVGAVMHAQMKQSFNKDFPQIPLFLRPSDNLFPLKKGDELFIDSPNAEINKKMQFKFDVVLNEKGVIEGEPLTKVLESMIDEVNNLMPVFNSYIAS